MALTAGTDITSGDILSGGDLVASAHSLKAGNVVSGVDFSATNAAASGAITLGTSGDMRLETTGGVDIASLLSAGNLNISAASLVAQNVTSHGTVAISGDTKVSGQILGRGDISVMGTNIKAGAIISGVDFAASKSSNGAIAVGNGAILHLLLPPERLMLQHFCRQAIFLAMPPHSKPPMSPAMVRPIFPVQRRSVASFWLAQTSLLTAQTFLSVLLLLVSISMHCAKAISFWVMAHTRLTSSQQLVI